MSNGYRNLAVCALALAVASCSGGSGLKTTTSVAPITTSNTDATLQLAVGTLYDPTGLLGTPGTYLNAMTTFRNPTGGAAFPHPGTATLTGPASLDLTLGSLYAYGQGPGANYTWGEPPAFNGDTYAGGFSTGYIITQSAPTPGTYTVTTSASVSGVTRTFTANATLPNAPLVLPAEPVPTWSSDGNGGGTFAMTNPPGVTESLIFIQTLGGSYINSFEIKSPATSVNVADGTFAVGATYYVFCLGADFPLIESAGPNSATVAAPPIASAAGTADLSASTWNTFTE